MPPKGWNVPKHYTGDDVKGLVAWLQRVLRDLKTFFSYVPTYNDRKTELEITGNIIMQPGATVDGVDISEIDLNPPEPISDHGELEGLADDDHTQYSRVDGTRPFTGPVGGVPPTNDDHLTTKLYVDSKIADEISNIPPPDLEGVVRDDGSTPFLAPQVGQPPVAANRLVTKGYSDEFYYGGRLRYGKSQSVTIQNNHAGQHRQWQPSWYPERGVVLLSGTDTSPNVPGKVQVVDVNNMTVLGNLNTGAGNGRITGARSDDPSIFYQMVSADSENGIAIVRETIWDLPNTVVSSSEQTYTFSPGAISNFSAAGTWTMYSPDHPGGFFLIASNKLFRVNTNSRTITLLRDFSAIGLTTGALSTSGGGHVHANSPAYQDGFIYFWARPLSGVGVNDGQTGIYRVTADGSSIEHVAGFGAGRLEIGSSQPNIPTAAIAGVYGRDLVFITRVYPPESERPLDYPGRARAMVVYNLDSHHTYRLWPTSDSGSDSDHELTLIASVVYAAPDHVVFTGALWRYQDATRTQDLRKIYFTGISGMREKAHLVYEGSSSQVGLLPTTLDEVLEVQAGGGKVNQPVLVEASAQVTAVDSFAGSVDAAITIGTDPVPGVHPRQAASIAPATVAPRAQKRTVLDSTGRIPIHFHVGSDGGDGTEQYQMTYQVLVWAIGEPDDT